MREKVREFLWGMEDLFDRVGDLYWSVTALIAVSGLILGLLSRVVFTGWMGIAAIGCGIAALGLVFLFLLFYVVYCVVFNICNRS